MLAPFSISRQLHRLIVPLVLLTFSSTHNCLAQTSTPPTATPATVTLQGHVDMTGPTIGWVILAQPQPTAVLPHDQAGKALGLSLPADGKFTVKNVSTGAQYVCLYFDGKLDPDSVLWLAPGEAHNDIVLKPKAPRNRLEAHLLNAEGKPLGRKVKVHLFNAVGGVDQNAGGTETDANGVVSFNHLPASSYALWLDNPPPKTIDKMAPDELPGSIFSDLDVTSGADTQSIKLTVPAAGATQGSLQLADGKTPASGYIVAVQSGTAPLDKVPGTAADYAQGARDSYAETTVQPDGSFTLHGLTKGVHQLDIRRPGERAPWSTILAAPVTPAEAMSIGTWTVPQNGWQMMFDGKTLNGWKETDFAGRSPVRVENGTIVLPMGNDMTGVTWTKDIPHIDYEVSLQAMRAEGHDFFCGLTFPVEDAPCSLILGGWGGNVIGLSSINGLDASENETTKARDFDANHWYRIRLRVTKAKIQAWIDEEQFVDLDLVDKKLSIRLEVEESKPFGIATWRTTGAIRDIRIRRLDTTMEFPK